MPTSSGTAAPILIVDDDEQVRGLVYRLLTDQGYACAQASNSVEARERLEREDFALILCDVNMPGESGIALVRDVLAEHPETAAVMVTGLDDPALADIALGLGAYGYVIKPFRTSELLINVTNALRRRDLEVENRAHRERLERTVLERTVELRQTIEQLEHSREDLRHSQEETIRRLSYAAEFRDVETGEHIERMSRYCTLIARALGIDDERCLVIRAASPMHDVGKIGIPDRILLNPDPLSAEEWQIMRQHAEIGYRILAGSGLELLDVAATIAHTHHERLDGSGYPRGLKGSEIPLDGRIAAVADVFDAVTSDRCYQRALPLEDALEIIRKGRGALFDPDVIDCFLGSIDDVLAVRQAHAPELANELGRALDGLPAVSRSSRNGPLSR